MLQLPVEGKIDEYKMIPLYIVKKGKDQQKTSEKKSTTEENTTIEESVKSEDKPVDLEEVKLE